MPEMPKDGIMKNNPTPGMTEAQEPTEEDKILFEYSKNEVINAVSTINDFCKTMITLVAGFFVAYFALLKFLGLGENVRLSTLLDPIHAGMPPVLFIISIIAFIISYTPYVRRRMSHHISMMGSYRKRTLSLKYFPMIIGVAAFIAGLAISLQICIQLLTHTGTSS